MGFVSSPMKVYDEMDTLNEPIGTSGRMWSIGFEPAGRKGATDGRRTHVSLEEGSS